MSRPRPRLIRHPEVANDDVEVDAGDHGSLSRPHQQLDLLLEFVRAVCGLTGHDCDGPLSEVLGVSVPELIDAIFADSN